MRRLFSIFALYIAGACCGLRADAAWGQENRAQTQLSAGEVLEKARQTLAAYSSIEYQFRSERVGPGKQSNVSKRVEIGEFAYADGKFCSEYTIDSDDYQTHGFSAFDGNVWQTMRDIPKDHLSVVGEISRVPYHIVQPVMKPFTPFLSATPRSDRFDWETYRGADIWSPIGANATLAEPRQVDGHPCAVVKHERTRGSTAGQLVVDSELCFAQDLDCYPILVVWQQESAKPYRGTLQVTELADLKTATGRAIVPLRIEIKSTVNSLQTTEIMTVDKTTLKVNEPIGKERFDLRRLMPASISFYHVTADQRERFESGPK